RRRRDRHDREERGAVARARTREVQGTLVDGVTDDRRGLVPTTGRRDRPSERRPGHSAPEIEGLFVAGDEHDAIGATARLERRQRRGRAPVRVRTRDRPAAGRSGCWLDESLPDLPCPSTGRASGACTYLLAGLPVLGVPHWLEPAE